MCRGMGRCVLLAVGAALPSALAGVAYCGGLAFGGRLAAARFVGAAEPSATDVQSWLKAVDDARNAFGEAVISARASQVDDGKVQTSADFDIYVKGRDRALIVFRGGKNDGRKALTVGEKMWLLVPGAENPVPITANQRLMGGASFADVARMRFAEDFT